MRELVNFLSSVAPGWGVFRAFIGKSVRIPEGYAYNFSYLPVCVTLRAENAALLSLAEACMSKPGIVLEFVLSVLFRSCPSQVLDTVIPSVPVIMRALSSVWRPSKSPKNQPVNTLGMPSSVVALDSDIQVPLPIVRRDKNPSPSALDASINCDIQADIFRHQVPLVLVRQTHIHLLCVRGEHTIRPAI